MAAISPHENVLPLLSFKNADDYTLLATPLATGGDTLRLMQSRNLVPLPEADTRGLFVQLMHGIRHMHNAGIVHRDIKCENLLLTGPTRRALLIGDFGFATRYTPGTKALKDAWGSLHYSAPEICTRMHIADS